MLNTMGATGGSDVSNRFNTDGGCACIVIWNYGVQPHIQLMDDWGHESGGNCSRDCVLVV